MPTSCKCFARCEADCVCDYDWTPPEVTRLRHDIERHIAMASELATENERLRDELAEARRDAERYQWLRKQFYSDSNNRTPHISQYPDPSGEYVQLTAGVDAAIDAAMAGGE